MAYSELAHRYATALFEIAKESKNQESFKAALSALQKTLESNPAVEKFISTPLIRAEEKEKTLKTALGGQGLPQDVFNFTLLLAKKNRLPLLPEIISAYQACDDKLNDITRGTVKSSTPLNQRQQDDITKKISLVLNKKVILKFSEEASLIGGLTAQVGSYTFDDSLSAHLKRIKEDLTRRIN
jgi:F-type H+-transporting ATPase subunit delta